jgi:hypothetical protein
VRRGTIGLRPAAAVTDDRRRLGNSIDHLAAMIPQLADRDFGHSGIE